jgi:hypothetical protein
MPRLESCYFVKPDQAYWRRMARVLEHTASEHCAGWQVRVQELAAPALEGSRSFVANTHKLDHFCTLIEAAEDGTELLLIDADTMILHALDDVWAQDFDIAYTVRTHTFPFNLGVMFLRVSEPVRAFVRIWREENRRFFFDGQAHQPARQRYGGINQASFGHLLQHGALSALRLHTLPCEEWNCEDTSWPRFDPRRTRILHAKSALRQALFRAWPVKPEFAKAMHWYRAAEARAHEMTRTA